MYVLDRPEYRRNAGAEFESFNLLAFFFWLLFLLLLVVVFGFFLLLLLLFCFCCFVCFLLFLWGLIYIAFVLETDNMYVICFMFYV